MSEFLTRFHAKAKPTDMPRFYRIANHYEKAIASGHFTITHAVDRAHGDYLGQNRAKDLPQKGETNEA
jgi:hypothetical protein